MIVGVGVVLPFCERVIIEASVDSVLCIQHVNSTNYSGLWSFESLLIEIIKLL